jgi:hypothetical protein
MNCFCMAPSPSSRLSLSLSCLSCFLFCLLATMASTSRRRPSLQVVFVLLHRIAAKFDEEFIKPHENNEVEPSTEVVVPSLSECEGLHLFYRLSLTNKGTRRFSRREYPALYDLSCVIVRARARGFTWK